MTRLDAKDLKILSELDTNARQSNGQIGRKVGLSRDVVKYRIDRLLEEGVILRFHAVVNYCKLGLTKYKLYLRLTNVSKEKREEIAEYFNNHSKTEWVVITTGRWDIIVGFLLKNVNEFDDEVRNAMTSFSEFIQERAITTSLSLVHQERGFLTGKKLVQSVVYHTLKDEQVTIDALDEKLLRVLANNARMPVTQLAKQLKTTARIVQYRVRELEKKEIILAYKAHLEPKSMNRIFCKAFLNFSYIREADLKKFLTYSSSLPGVLWPQRVMGNWDFEVDFELSTYDDFQDVLLQFREKFPDLIRDQEFCITWKELKLDLYPNATRAL